ncbi:response regulator transcription factor [Christensenella intestinihominis]|uniref:response regulator transcription factor n=1 Tax=Christensenella intestinihominis TaxID=1851429 RepID=UPI000831A43B|nr:response regulator transcription factor [Christensenella intestinihominis]
MTNLLIADADAETRLKIRNYADPREFLIDEASDGISAIKLFRRKEYDLIALDVFLPELDGLNVCRQIRKVSAVPVVFLTAKSREFDRLAGFEAGGDDYIVKPFYVSELFARIHAILNRCRGTQKRILLSVDGLSVNLNSRSVWTDDIQVFLTPKEYDLLVFLMQNPNRALSRDAILSNVWGEEFNGTDRTVDTHIRTLRDSIRPYGNHILTVWGIGYKFER